MFTERLKAFLRGGENHPAHTVAVRAPGSATVAPQVPRRRPIAGRPCYTRSSNGLEQFFFALRDTTGLSLLDFSAANQANITFITNLGHRIYAEDFLDAVDSTFPEDEFFEAQTDPRKAQAVLDQCLNFPEGHFDGALVWDCLQYIAPPLLQEVVDRLYEILRPNAYLLAFFSADERAPLVKHDTYRISDAKNLLLTPQSQRPPSQHFSSRSLERLFGHYAQVKFFLTRDSLREVLVKR